MIIIAHFYQFISVAPDHQIFTGTLIYKEIFIICTVNFVVSLCAEYSETNFTSTKLHIYAFINFEAMKTVTLAAAKQFSLQLKV